MQCKDIPDRPILEFLASLNGEWANWYFGNEKDVGKAMPEAIPEKLKLAKMRQMIHRGIVDDLSFIDFLLERIDRSIASLQRS